MGYILLFAASAACSSLGFYRLVWFISLGYTLSIGTMILSSLMRYSDLITPISLTQHLLLLAWSLRLFSFLWSREMDANYLTSPQAQNSIKLNEKTALQRLPIYLGVVPLYVLMYLPGYYSIINGSHSSWSLISLLGLCMTSFGFLLEVASDHQKSTFKTEFPKKFCNTGLYKFVRCPNYLGEVFVWVGFWVTSIPYYLNASQWVFSTLGMLGIFYVMLESTSRLDAAQEAKYGANQEYKDYVKRTPILFPIPIYRISGLFH